MAYESLPLFPDDVPAPRSKRLKSIDAAYIAGLLDGEGYFGIQLVDGGKVVHKPGYKYYRYFVVLVMTSKPFLETIRAIAPWGESAVTSAYQKLRGRARPSWKIRWTGRHAASLCRDILPYLRLKRRHAELIIWLDDAKAFAVKERPAGRGGSKYPAYIIDMHARARNEFRLLNARGQDNP